MLFYWRILTPNLADRQSFPPGDFHAQFWAFTTLEVRELSQGRLPLWNPYTFAGSPFWADVQAAVFYPPSLLTILLSTPWGFSLFALEIEAVFHFWLAATFMYLFIRDLTHSRAAAIVSALTFTFSGYLTGYPSQQLAVLEVDIWLPLILFFLYRAYQKWEMSKDLASLTSPPSLLRLYPSAFLLILAGISWGLAILAGHPQSALIVAYISTAYFIFLWLTAYPIPLAKQLIPYIFRLILHFGLFIITGVALAAIQLIPAIEYTLLSVRVEGTYDKMSGGFSIIDPIQLLLPGQITFYSPLYIGIVGLTLVLWLTFAKPNRHVIFWATIALVTLLISFGGNTFFYSPLYLSTPGFSIFRGQERWAFATTFSLSVLVGYGFNKLLTNNQSSPFQSSGLQTLTKYLFFLALLLDFFFFFGLNDAGWTTDNPFYNLFNASTLLTLLLGLTWLLWTFSAYLHPVFLTIFSSTLICLNLFTVNWKTNLYPQLPEWHTQQAAVITALKDDAALTPNKPYRVYNEFRVFDNYGLPYQIEDLWGASPLRPERYDKFLAPPMPLERTWELLNVKYVITWRQELYLPSTIIYQEEAADGTTYLHRLETIGPRAWLVTQAQISDDDTILQKIADPNFDRWQIALLEPNAKPLISQLKLPLTETKTPPPNHHLPLTFPDPQTISIQVKTDTPAILILSESYYPGWQAFIDGQNAPLLRANYILRAVPIPVGQHTVKLIFQPLSFTIGAIISAVTLLFITIMVVRTPE